MTDRITVKCSHCLRTLKLKNPKQIGKTVKCPKCGKPFFVQIETPANFDEDEPVVYGRYRQKPQYVSTKKGTRRKREEKLRTKRGLAGSSELIQLVRTIVAGLVGGLIGAGIWVYLASIADDEIGYAAWAVGLLTGVGIRLAGNYEGALLGWIAAGIAVVCILAAQLAVDLYTVDQLLTGFSTENMVTAAVANEIVNQRVYDSESVTVTKPINVHNFNANDLYPVEIWEEAKKRCAEMSADERAVQELQFRSRFGMGLVIRNTVANLFLSGFGLFDIVWVVIAAGSAYAVVVSLQ